MVANEVRLLQCLMLIVVAIWMLEVGVQAHRVFGWGSERLPVVVKRQLADKLRPLLTCML